MKLSVPSLRRAGARLVACAALALPHAATAQEDAPSTADKIDATRTKLSEWVDLRRLISKEKSDWMVGKDLLQQRIELVKEQIASLTEKTTETRKGIDEAVEKKQKLDAEYAALKKTADDVTAKLVPIEQAIKSLLKRLPPPLLENIRPLTQQLPKDSTKSEQPLSTRLRNIAGILNEVNRFNNEISITTEVREIKPGQRAEVDTLYFGIGQAFYVSTKGDAAGVGTASKDAWVWRPANEHAARIAKAILIFRDKEAASFVRLPIRVE